MEGEPRLDASDANWKVSASKITNTGPKSAVGGTPTYSGVYEWSELPQSIGPEGGTIELKVSANSDKQNRIATGIAMIGGFDFYVIRESSNDETKDVSGPQAVSRVDLPANSENGAPPI